jgi:rRNA-processing protein FCF1
VPDLRPAILFLDTNVLLDMPRPEEYRFSGRKVSLVVIPEVMRELRGLARAPARGQVGQAMQALGALESLANRRGSALGIPIVRSSASIRILPGADSGESADAPLIRRAKAEQGRGAKALIAVVTKDWGVAERARTERVKSILLRGLATAYDIEHGIVEHDSILDIDL